MTPSREPVVWSTFAAGVVAAAVSAGLLTGDQAAHVNGAVQVLVPVVSLLLPVLAGLVARRKVSPVTPTPEHRA